MLDRFNQTQQQIAANDRQSAQSALMQMFQQEAARQKPYSDLPANLMKQDNAAANQLNNSMAMADYRDSIKTRRDAKLKQAPAQLMKTITTVAQQFGEDPHFFSHLAATESNYDPNVKNKLGSGAGGMYQIMPRTAAGLGMSDEDRFDPEVSTKYAIQLNNQNRQVLANGLGREPTQGELYLAWQQGASGALRLLQNRDADAARVVGMKAVTQNGGRRGMTAGQFADMWIDRFQKGYDRRIANLRKPKPDDTTSDDRLEAIAKSIGIKTEDDEELGS